MTNEQFYARVLRKARRANDASLLVDAVAEFEEMLQSWERSPFHPWFLETVASGFVTVADTQTVDMPSNYLLLVEDTRVLIVDGDGADQKLRRGYHEDLEDYYLNEDAALPKHYDIFANKMYFGPVPDAAYTVKFKYYASTTAPESDGNDVSNPWILNAQAFCVSSLAQVLVQDYIKDDKRAAALAMEAQKHRIELHKYNEARKHVDMDYEVDR